MIPKIDKDDIGNLDDIKTLVDNFYGKMREDNLLKDIFNNVIQDRWAQHLEKMYTFWQTVLLNEYMYKGTPFPPHLKLPITQKHFDRWLQLFNTTVDEYFVGEKAERSKWQSNRMAEMFCSKIEYYKEQNFKPLI